MMAIDFKKIFYIAIAIPVLVHLIVLVASFYRIIVSENVSDEVFSKYERNIANYTCKEKEVRNRILIDLKFIFMDGQELFYERYNLSCSEISKGIKNSGGFIEFYIFEFFWYKKIIQVDLDNQVLISLDREKEGILGLIRLVLFVLIPMVLIVLFVKNKFKGAI